MAPAKKSREVRLQQKRAAERNRKKRIRNDPVLWEIEREKQRLRNQKKYETGQLKKVAEMTPSEHEACKKRWKEGKNKLLMKKKKKEQQQLQQSHESDPGPAPEMRLFVKVRIFLL